MYIRQVLGLQRFAVSNELCAGLVLRLDGGENVWVPVQGVVGVVGVLDGARWVGGCVGVRGDAIMSPCGWGLFND